MNPEVEAIYQGFEALGTIEVHKHLASHVYGEDREQHAQVWLAMKDREAREAQSEITSSLMREANATAGRTASAADRAAAAAENAALFASTATSAALASAKEAVEANRLSSEANRLTTNSNLIATIALIAAVVAIAISIVVAFAK